MSNLRDLAPRPPGQAAPNIEPATATRQPKVAVACGTCRLRRTKCDGVKPTCRACMTRASNCEWPAPTGQQLVNEQKQMIKELENDKSALYEVLWFLQTTSPEAASDMLSQLRSNPGGDIGAIVQHFAQYRRDVLDSTTSSSTASTASTSPETSPEISGTPITPGIVDFSQLLDARGPAVQLNDVTSPATRTQFATVYHLEGPLEWFFNCVGALFYIMDPDEVRKNIELLKASTAAHIPLGDLVAPNTDMRTATLAAELAGMASIGVVHANLADPTTAPPAELADYFYAVAKMGLDAAIQYSPVRAVKICALVAMYNIVVHATISLAYLDLGLSLARRCGTDARELSGISRADFDDRSRTYRTLVHLQCWLSASLDYVPDALGSAALSAVEDVNAPPEDMIRRECVKVSIIKALMLHRVPKTAPVPEDIVADFRTQLLTFHSELMDWMSLGQLFSDESDMMQAQFRPIIFYIHLFYLSAMMLLSRRLVIAYVALDVTGKVSLPTEARLAIEEGFVAAQTNARLMELMLSEGKIVQVCWLCIFTSYTAGVMIAYSAFQKALHGLPFASDMELLDRCIKVLSYCALKDAMAGKFRDLLNRQFNDLQHLHAPNSNAAIEPPSNSTEFLFTLEAGSTSLHTAARGLLNLIQHPFSGLGDISSLATLSNRAETTMGTHLEWQWELQGSESRGNSMEHRELYGIDRMMEPTEVCGMDSMMEPTEVCGMDNMMEPKDVCGTGMSMGAYTSLGQGAWSTWTPPVGI